MGRFNGPYYDERTGEWYIKAFCHKGKGGSHRLSYETEQEATERLNELRKVARLPEETTVQQAIERWAEDRKATFQDTNKLKVLLMDLLAPDLSKPVGRIDGDRGAELYERLVGLPVKRGGKKGTVFQRRSDAYQQLALGRAKDWGRWLVRQKFAKGNPFDAVEPKGRAKAGAESKVWLDPAQLSSWAEAAVKTIEANELGDGALAAYLVYAIGLRASEPASMHALQPSVPVTEKTPYRAARARFRVKGSAQQRIRHLWLPLPAWLAPFFEGRAERGERLLRVGRQTVRKAVIKICERAGVPVTCPHGLRESVIDYQAAQEVETGGLDQRMLDRMGALHGHTGRIMEKHYMAPGRREEAAAIQRLRVIQGGKVA